MRKFTSEEDLISKTYLFSLKNFPVKHVALTFVCLLIDYAQVLLSMHVLIISKASFSVRGKDR